jgi:hypothetical protein
LRGDGVHEHRRWVRGFPTRRIQTHPSDRLPTLSNRGSIGKPSHLLNGNLGRRSKPQSRDQDLKGCSHLGRARLEGTRDPFLGNPEPVALDSIKITCLLAQRFLTAIANGIDQGPHAVNGSRRINRGAGNQPQKFSPR